MNKIFALLAALAIFNVHVARGDGCKATVDGKEATLQAGDRYCSDDITSKTCNSDGQFTEDKCPPESKCLKSPTGFSTLCRQIVKNDDKDNQAPPPAPAPAGQPQPESPKQGEPAPAPRDEGKQADQGAQAPTASDSDSCDGGAFKAGQRRCKSDTTYSVCNWGGVWIDGDCPPESKCMENKDQKQVLCRQVKKNAPWPTGPSGSEEPNSNQQPKVSKRSAQDQAPQQAGQPPVDPRTKTCNGPRGTFKSGELYCKSETTTSLCAYGEWVDYECPSGSTCEENKELKQVLCRQYVTNPPQQNRPGEGPNSNNQPKRFRRDTQDKAAVPKQDDQPRQATDDPRSRTCTGPAGTYKLGERYCSSETGSSVCSYGQWVNFDCPPGSRCLENKEQRQVLCRQYVTNPPQQQPSNEGPNSNNQPKRFKRDNQDKAAFPKQADQGAQPPVDPRTKTCSGPAGTYNSGDRYCASDSRTRVCAYGEWVDIDCPSGSQCLENKEQKQVLCRQYVTNPPQANGQNQRFKRDNNETATPTGTEAPETCTSDKGTFKTGDRYCKSETTHTVCNYGQWIDGECDAGSKCMENKDLKQVLCRIVNKNAPWPAGPSGSEAQNPEPQAASLPPQASPQPNPQPQPTPQPAPEAQPQPTPQPAPQPQPQPQPSQGSEGTPQPSQPKPTGTEAPLPAIPAQEPKDCEGGLKEAEQVCTGDNGYKMCHDGQFITEACPPNSKCLASTASKHVLCREIRRSVVVEKPQERRR